MRTGHSRLTRRAMQTIALIALVVACSSSPLADAQADTAGPVCRLEAAPFPSSDASVTVDASRRFQTIQGFGTTERLFDDPHVTNTFDAVTRRAAVIPPPAEQDRILDALYVELGLTRVRYNPRDDQGTDVGIEQVNDNADPAVTDLSRFDFSWKKNDGHITYVKAVVPRGVTTFYASPLTLESFMTEANPDEYVEWAMAILRRWRAQGVEMPFYSILNEPGNPRGGVTWSGAWIREVTKRLGAKLKAEGFRTRIVVPDDLNPTEAFARLQTILADPDARQYVGAIAYHLYGSADRDKVKRLAEQYGLPVWMTEFSQPDWLGWARTMHAMLADYDAAAVDFMWGFFGQWESGTQLVTIRSAGNAYTGFERTKHFFTMGQYSRFVRPGAVRIGAVTADPSLLVTAYQDGPRVVIVAINDAHSDRTVRFDVISGIPCGNSVQSVRTSETENGRVLPEMQLPVPRFVTTLAAASVTTLVVR